MYVTILLESLFFLVPDLHYSEQVFYESLANRFNHERFRRTDSHIIRSISFLQKMQGVSVVDTKSLGKIKIHNEFGFSFVF